MKILIVGPSWIGDMVMAQALFKSLKQEHPQATIDVLAPAWTRAILQRMPEVTEAIVMPVGHGELGLGKRLKLGRELKRQAYDQAIVLPNSFKSALVPRFAGIPLRTGWRGEARGWLLNDCRTLDKEAYPLMVERFVALAYPAQSRLPHPFPQPALSINENHEALLSKLDLDSDRPVIVFCPGAEFGPAKKWPENYFAEVADVLIREGRQVWLLGSDNDRQSCEAILDQLAEPEQAHCRNLAGLTSIGEAVDLLSLAALVLSNDSGLMHVAAALGKKLVVIYGSTSPDFTPPLTDKVAILRLDLPCSPCFQRECPLGHLDCLRKLQASTVTDTIGKLLEQNEA